MCTYSEDVFVCAALTGSLQQVQEEGAFVHLLHPHNLLCDVLTGGAYTTHRQEDVVVQEIPRQNLRQRERERGREIG